MLTLPPALLPSQLSSTEMTALWNTYRHVEPVGSEGIRTHLGLFFIRKSHT